MGLIGVPAALLAVGKALGGAPVPDGRQVAVHDVGQYRKDIVFTD